MTAEHLHDALSLLSADLIAETDRKRSAPRPQIRWQRYTAIAACFAMVFFGSIWCLKDLGTGGAKETAAEAPAVMMQGPASMDSAADEIFPEAQEAAPMGEAATQDKEAVQGSKSATATAGAAPVTFYMEGMAYALSEKQQTIVAEILLNLDYQNGSVCECIAEMTVVIGQTKYAINLEEGFARCRLGQASLTDAQIHSLEQIAGDLIKGT